MEEGMEEGMMAGVVVISKLERCCTVSLKQSVDVKMLMVDEWQMKLASRTESVHLVDD